MDRPARTLSGSLMPRVLGHAYGWVPIMAPDTLFCPPPCGFLNPHLESASPWKPPCPSRFVAIASRDFERRCTCVRR